MFNFNIKNYNKDRYYQKKIYQNKIENYKQIDKCVFINIYGFRYDSKNNTNILGYILNGYLLTNNL